MLGPSHPETGQLASDSLAEFSLQRVFSSVMAMTDNQKLLQDYARNGSDAAFRELVTRYVDLVLSTALRLVDGDKHRAQDVAQTVFMDLARQASKLATNTTLGGWLHRDTCFVASKMMRGEHRRQVRERQAAEMNALSNTKEDLEHLAPMLDEAINQLDEEDRKAILLRFYERLDFRSVGEALGSSENAAQKRVSRALEQLHAMLRHRGVALSAAALGTAMAGEVVTAAPAGLATALAGTALAGVGTGTAGTVTGVLAMTKLKAPMIGLLAVLGVTAPLAFQHRSLARLRAANQGLQDQIAGLASMASENERLSNQLAKANAETLTPDETSELLRLRGEIGRLRSMENELATLKQQSAQRAANQADGGAPSQDPQPATPQFFYVAGEVATPGRFPWTNGMSMAAAIELAHGYTEFANRSVAQIKDATGSSVTLNYTQPIDHKETAIAIRGRPSGYDFFPGQPSAPQETTNIMQPGATANLIQPGVTVVVPRLESGEEKK